MIQPRKARSPAGESVSITQREQRKVTTLTYVPVRRRVRRIHLGCLVRVLDLSPAAASNSRRDPCELPRSSATPTGQESSSGRANTPGPISLTCWLDSPSGNQSSSDIRERIALSFLSRCRLQKDID